VGERTMLRPGVSVKCDCCNWVGTVTYIDYERDSVRVEWKNQRGIQVNTTAKPPTIWRLYEINRWGGLSVVNGLPNNTGLEDDA